MMRNNSLPPKIAQIFGVSDDAQELVGSFDYSGDNADRERGETFVYIIAPSLGEALPSMDKELKIIVSATTRAISDIRPRDRTWENVRTTLLHHPLLEKDEPECVRVDRLDRDTSDWFKSNKLKREESIGVWFDALLCDDDVRQATPIDIRRLASVVAATGAKVQSSLSLTNTSRDVTHEQTVVDVRVLRFPDVTHNYFKAYRIQLNAWAYSKSIMGVRTNKSGIAGHYTCCKFKARSEVIAKVSEEAQDSAARDAEELLGF